MERVKGKWKIDQDKWASLIMRGAWSYGRTGKPALFTDQTYQIPAREFHVLPSKQQPTLNRD